MYKQFEQFLRRNKIVLTTPQKVMAMAIMSVFDLHPAFLKCQTGKTQLFKWIDTFLSTLPNHLTR